MKTLYTLAFISIVCNLTSCVRFPDIKAINKELGIEIPKKFEIIQADSDPFGLGADAEITYVFQFGSSAYDELVKAIESSKLFNTASEKRFDTLPLENKMNIIRILAENKMTSYWIKSDSNYVYDGNSLIINEPDQAYKQSANQGIYLPNQREFSDGTPISLWEVKAIVDRKKHTLYYKYVHI